MSHLEHRLLCVDDDPGALDDLREAVSRTGACISAAYFGSPGKALAAQCAEPADIVISDLRLGSTTGLKLIADMQSVAPGAVYMLISGEADLDSALRAVNEAPVFRFLTKPARPDELKRALDCASGELERRKTAAVSQSSLAAVDRLGVAIAVLDRELRLLHANAQAQAILSDSGVFEISASGELRVRVAKEARAFREFLFGLKMPGVISDVADVFRLRRPDLSAPVVVSATRCPDGSGGASFFSLIISNPARRVFSSVHALAIALNLTPSEARVVFGLAEGSTLSEAARQAGVSVSTARTYLKNVFSKTGVTRQAELVRLAILSAA
ncbi:MAG: DNA-binding response regulator [Parvularculaceae bacterium]